MAIVSDASMGDVWFRAGKGSVRAAFGVTLTALVLLPVGSASAAGELAAVAGSYARAGGSIPACTYTSAQLEAALSQAGGDVQQYGADLIDAVQRALAARAAGACDRHNATSASPASNTAGSTGPSTGPGSALSSVPGSAVSSSQSGGAASVPASPAGTISTPPAPPANAQALLPTTAEAIRARRASAGDGLSSAAVRALVAAGLLAAICAGLLLAGRRLGWDPRWLVSARHAVSEASYRSAGMWEDFSDWARPRR